MAEHDSDTSARQYLTFRLGEEMFALDVVQVREILDVTTITKVPRSLDFMRGVINVRGSVVPVVDLRMKFDMTASEQTLDTRIVVMEIALEGNLTTIGTLADAVHNVMDLAPDQIEAPPKIGAKLNTDFIKGIGQHNQEFIIVLDVDRLFSANELALVSQSENADEKMTA